MRRSKLVSLMETNNFHFVGVGAGLMEIKANSAFKQLELSLVIFSLIILTQGEVGTFLVTVQLSD
jgi:hypothetical protein